MRWISFNVQISWWNWEITIWTRWISMGFQDKWYAIDAFISISKAVPHACGSVGFHFFADLVVDSKGRAFWSELILQKCLMLLKLRTQQCSVPLLWHTSLLSSFIFTFKNRFEETLHLSLLLNILGKRLVHERSWKHFTEIYTFFVETRLVQVWFVYQIIFATISKKESKRTSTTLQSTSLSRDCWFYLSLSLATSNFYGL